MNHSLVIGVKCPSAPSVPLVSLIDCPLPPGSADLPGPSSILPGPTDRIPPADQAGKVTGGPVRDLRAGTP
ncbi:hypothetical protein GCM10017559_73240 [Streptosporangium longisporum]|uniref:Uncharacterized protein n=1 Tax=Streptosporangium longisporum TaxID=46187 RepID=A0ABP6L7D5_9ACTN